MFATVLIHEAHDAAVVGPWLNTGFFSLQLLVAAIFHQWLYVRLVNLDMDVQVRAGYVTPSVWQESIWNGCIWHVACHSQ